MKPLRTVSHAILPGEASSQEAQRRPVHQRHEWNRQCVLLQRLNIRTNT